MHYSHLKVPTPKSCPPRIARQIIALQDLSFEVRHCLGSRNIADWTSRCPLLDSSDITDFLESDAFDTALIRMIYDDRENDALTIDKIKNATASDDTLQFLIQRILPLLMHRSSGLCRAPPQNVNNFRGRALRVNRGAGLVNFATIHNSFRQLQ